MQGQLGGREEGELPGGPGSSSSEPGSDEGRGCSLLSPVSLDFRLGGPGLWLNLVPMGVGDREEPLGLSQ